MYPESMGYEDPAPLAKRIADAASELQTLIMYHQFYSYFSGNSQSHLSEELRQQLDVLYGNVKQLRAFGNSHGMPPTDALMGSGSIAGMPVWRLLGPGQVHGAPSFSDYDPPPAEAEIVIYLDKYRNEDLEGIQDAAMRLGHELGYSDFLLTDEEIGSIFRRLRGKLKAGVESDFVQQKMQELDIRASIEISGRAQAETDAIKTSSAVSLIASLADIPNAVVRVGGLLVVKQTNAGGQPAVMTRELSTREIRALELNPGIQKDPQGVLQLLSAAVAQLAEDERACG
jgi:hypothetical protein